MFPSGCRIRQHQPRRTRIGHDSAGAIASRTTIDAGGAELVLSGGSVNSPRLLLLSGIGPADELGALDINTVHNLPGVGKNFQDHMDVYLTAETTPVAEPPADRSPSPHVRKLPRPPMPIEPQRGGGGLFWFGWGR